MTKKEQIQLIKNRIDSEFKKHNTEKDWPEIAARKIYFSLFPKVDECPVCKSKDMFSFHMSHYKCRKCKKQFTS